MILTIWIIIAVVLFIVELMATLVIALYFSLGAFAAAGVAAAGGSVLWQFVAFSVVSLGLLLATRPYLLKYVDSPDVATNVDRMVGKTGLVTIDIDNDLGTGQVRIGTDYWTARSVDAEIGVIPVNTKIRIESVEGVTARVVPIAARKVQQDVASSDAT